MGQTQVADCPASQTLSFRGEAAKQIASMEKLPTADRLANYHAWP